MLIALLRNTNIDMLLSTGNIWPIVSSLLYALVALLIALTFHEASHALVANWLGDDTPKKMGRLSLNPLAHLDPFGVVMMLIAGVGWGKPVAINGDKLRPGPKIGMALVAIAGPISNLLLAFVLALPIRFHLVQFTSQKVFELGGKSIYFSIGQLLLLVVMLNLALAIFNLIPISPLDGSRLWQIILPDRIYFIWVRYEIIGVFVVVGLVLADVWLQTGILTTILQGPLRALWGPVVGWGSPPL
ncbi:MAG: site-2 protease family protein [Anaerolineae bacterium]